MKLLNESEKRRGVKVGNGEKTAAETLAERALSDLNSLGSSVTGLLAEPRTSLFPLRHLVTEDPGRR